mgnify:CR=1 FL=1
MNTSFVSLGRGEESTAATMFRGGHIFLIPHVDDDNQLVDVLESEPG